jgi:hypothetical protein
MNVRSRAALLFVTGTLLALHAPASAAQSITQAPIAPQLITTSVERQQLGPTNDALAVGVRVTVPTTSVAAPRANAGLGQSEALMIVGGASILVGAIIGGDAGTVFMVGGAVVGLYGLYKYLQ